MHSALTDRADAKFTIRADLPAGYTDSETGNNSSGGTYTYASTPVAPFAFDGAATGTATSSNDYDVVAKVKNIPTGAKTSSSRSASRRTR